MRNLYRIPTLVVLMASLGACSLQPNDFTMPGQPGVGSDGYTVTVAFNQVENLVPNSAVELNDARIGTVAKIHLDGWHAIVTLRLLKSNPIPSNATFAIGQKTLLGAQYVEVKTPAHPATTNLADGANLDVGQTGAYPETEQVLASAALLLNNGGLSQINTITTQMNDALRSREPDVRSLVVKLQDVLGVVNANKGSVLETLSDLNTLAGGLAKDRVRLGKAIDALSPAAKTLNQNLPTLINGLNAVSTLSAHGSALLAQSQQSLVTTVANLRTVVTNVKSAAGALPEALRFMITLPFPIRTTPNAVHGDFTNLFATIDLTQLPTGSTAAAAAASPAGQATNPLLGPLGATNGLLNSTLNNLGGTVSGLTGTLLGTPLAPSSPSSSTGTCLLGLLGACS